MLSLNYLFKEIKILSLKYMAKQTVNLKSFIVLLFKTPFQLKKDKIQSGLYFENIVQRKHHKRKLLYRSVFCFVISGKALTLSPAAAAKP